VVSSPFLPGIRCLQSRHAVVHDVTRVLGLDIGASTTRARLVADGAVEAEARAASASMTAAGPDRAAAALTDLLAQLPELTGSLDAVCAGAAGVVTAPYTREFLRARLEPLTISGRVVIVDDAALVLPAAGLTDGIAVICGTGSIAVGCWRGRTALAGGWGYLLGDEGSGYWIVRSAIRELLGRAASDLPPGPLSACLLEAAGARNLTQLRTAFYRHPEPWHWARHAPAVLDCGDDASAGIAWQAAQELAGLVGNVAVRLGDPDRVPVVLAGGLMAHQQLRAATVAAVAAALPASPVQALADPPVAGAVRLAAAAASGHE
jgi:N-acetylglucosamine kinase-like BadF-type ATPase